MRPPSRTPDLPSLTEFVTTLLEYRISDLTTGRHLVRFYRDGLSNLGVLRSSEAAREPAGRKLRVGGLVIIRQTRMTATASDSSRWKMRMATSTSRSNPTSTSASSETRPSRCW